MIKHLSNIQVEMRKNSFPAIIAGIFCLSVFFIFWNLGHVNFWDDEAHVAILSKNYVQFGAWTAWDGRNLFPDHNSIGLGTDLTYRMVQLDSILVSQTFKFLEPTFFSARLPFAIAGVVTLIIFFIYLNHEFKQSKALILLCFACLAFSTNYLFWARNCRYYILAILFAIGVWCLYKLYLSHRRPLYLLMLSLSSTLLFYSHALCGGAFLVAVAANHFIFHHREFNKRDWMLFALPLGLFLATAIAYVWSSQVLSFDYTKAIATVNEPWYIRCPDLIYRNLRDINTVGMLPWPVLLSMVVIAFTKSRMRLALVQVPVECTSLILIYTIVLSSFSPQLTRITYYADIRYLAILLPLFALVTGYVLWLIYRLSRVSGLVLFFVVINTTLITMFPGNTGFGLLLPGLIKEITQPYPTSYSEVTNFMKTNAEPGQTWYAQPDFVNKPLLFSLGEDYQLCCTLDYKTPLPRGIVKNLKAPLFIEENFPDWFIAFNMQDFKSQHIDRLGYFSRRHYQNGRLVTYPYTLYKWLDVNWDQTQRPELFWHSYGPVTDFKPEKGVFIFKRGKPIYLKEGQADLNLQAPHLPGIKP